MIVISLDGLKDTEFERLASDPANYPNIAGFKKRACYNGGVKTIFVSNTYPIHTTIATGKLPCEHGVISNYADDDLQGNWAQMASYIKQPTIWDAAHKKGLKIASILWPVTGKAKIKWNLPETHITKGQNQLVQNLKNGSPLFQIKAFLKHGKKMNGLDPICLDNFTSSVAADVIKQKRPGLTLIHLLAYDTTSHYHGSKSEALVRACKSLDDSVGKILTAAGDQTVLMFSDHGHLDVEETIDLRKIFDNVYEQCGGSAFFKSLADAKNHPWFGRLLTQEEMEVSGYAGKAVFGIAAKQGYCFGTGAYKSNHGYPADYPDYNVFYAIAGRNFSPATKLERKYGDVRDITSVISSILSC